MNQSLAKTWQNVEKFKVWENICKAKSEFTAQIFKYASS